MIRLSSLSFLLLLFSTLIQASDHRSGPTDLMIEFLRNPSDGAVNDPKPEFSWIPGTVHLQKSYQVLVASSQKKLREGDGDLWNSGIVPSQNSINVEYAGQALNPNTTYFWNVRIWNGSEKNGMVSETQQFKTGSFDSEYETSVMPLNKHIVQPQRVTKENPQGNFFADFGKAAFGTLRVQIESKNSDTVVVHLGEKLISPGRIDTNPGGTIRYRRIPLAVEKGSHWYTVVIPSIERNSKYPAIVMPAQIGEVTPFRYCEIEKNTPSIICRQVEQVAVNYYWDQSQSSFSCTDKILNQVWDLCKYSIKATTFCGVYVDGDRERIPYEADAYINQLGHYCTDTEYSIGRHSHEYLMVNPTWPTEWIMHSVMMAYTDYLYTGDAESLAHFYKDLKNKTLIALAREDGLISTQTGLLNQTVLSDIHMKAPIRDIVDWPLGERDGNEMPKVNTVINAFHYESLKLMSLIAGVLKYSDDELFYKHRAESVKNVINQKLFDQEGKKYLDGDGSAHSSLHANIFPMAFGLVPDEDVKVVAAFIKSKGMACSVYAAQFLLEALYRAGEDKAALELMCATNDRSWWNMILAGSTITLEAWDARYKPNLDWNHAWGAVPANMVTRGLWGICPLTPGFGTAQIKPQTGGLTASKIKVPTVRGPINCEFKTDNTTRFEMKVSIAPNMKAVVYVPVRDISNPVFFVDGKRVDGTRQGRFFVTETSGGNSRFEVKSGGK